MAETLFRRYKALIPIPNRFNQFTTMNEMQNGTRRTDLHQTHFYGQEQQCRHSLLSVYLDLSYSSWYIVLSRKTLFNWLVCFFHKKNHNTKNKKKTPQPPPKNNLTNIYVETIKIKVLNTDTRWREWTCLLPIENIWIIIYQCPIQRKTISLIYVHV